MSELKPIPGITIIGPIPAEVQQITVFSAGIVASIKRKDSARALIRYFASTQACRQITEDALEPISIRSGQETGLEQLNNARLQGKQPKLNHTN